MIPMNFGVETKENIRELTLDVRVFTILEAFGSIDSRAAKMDASTVGELRKRLKLLKREIWDIAYRDLELEIRGALEAVEAGGTAEAKGRLLGVLTMLEFPKE